MGWAVALGMQENASQPAFLGFEELKMAEWCFAGFCWDYEGTVIVFCHYVGQ